MMTDAVVVVGLAVFALGLLAGISAGVAICSRYLKAKQRAFALAGARPQVGPAWGRARAMVLLGPLSDPLLAERK